MSFREGMEQAKIEVFPPKYETRLARLVQDLYNVVPEYDREQTADFENSAPRRAVFAAFKGIDKLNPGTQLQKLQESLEIMDGEQRHNAHAIKEGDRRVFALLQNVFVQLREYAEDKEEGKRFPKSPVRKELMRRLAEWVKADEESAIRQRKEKNAETARSLFRPK